MAQPRVLIVLALAAMVSPIWISIGDHSFNGRSAARYAVVSQEMVNTGDWIVPHYLGRIHLTKPPLVYWFESASIELFGHTFLAVRLPSAIAGTLGMLFLFWFGRRQVSTRVGLVAAGLYSIMPMTIFPARMTVTDSIVNLSWMLILYAGFLRTQHPGQKRWRALFMLGASMGMLAKGPVLLIPIGLVWVWLLISDDAERRPKRMAVYLFQIILAMLPVLLWAYAVYVNEPNALDIWKHETIDRAVGAGDHSRPIWFFIPILLAGCFPASAMLILPGINLRWRQALGSVRSGGLAGFLGWSIIVPFVIYSLISGKLASYLLPICSPLALLSAIMLEEWFTNDRPEPAPGRRLPEVRVGLLIGTVLYITALALGVWHFYGPEHIVWVLGLVPAALVAIWLVCHWSKRAIRVIGIGAFIGAWLVGWLVMEEFEDVALSQMSYLAIAHETFGDGGWQGETGVYQLEDGTIVWDFNGKIEHFHTPDGLRARLETIDEPILILAAASNWNRLSELDKAIFNAGTIKARWEQWPGADQRYLVVCEPMTTKTD